MTSRRADDASARPADKPAARTVDVSLPAPFDGWRATFRADFPARHLVALQSGSVGAIVDALDAMVIAHNFPGEDGELAASMADVDPYDGVLLAGKLLFDAIAKLPNRLGPR